MYDAWNISKPIVESRNGVVVSQHKLASAAGAEVLTEGGNAVDAAVTTALTLGVVEPWLSGIGGGGFLLYHHKASGRTHGLDFGMVTPRNLDSGRYPLQGGDSPGLFGWPTVVEDRNLKGYESICVPGAVDGFGRALESFGTISWARALSPAIRQAKEGLQVDWYTTLSVATAATELAEFPATQHLFMPSGFPPSAPLGRENSRLTLTPLADTLSRLAEAGYRDFYEGELAELLLTDLQEGGSAFSSEDLAGYHAESVEPLTLPFGEATLYAMPGLSGGPSYLEVMSELSKNLASQAVPASEAYAAIAEAIQNAYRRRLSTMGAGDSCTTHVSVVDRWGNTASLTNTLLARFGSKVTLPQTGVLMNNGMMWFDPIADRPNSIRPGAKPLANMCPVIVTRGDDYRAALGAAGGRRIMPALAQLTAFLFLYRMPLETAMQQPRLDTSGRDVVVGEALPTAVTDALTQRFSVKRVVDTVYPPQFAVPSVAVWEDGAAKGAAHSNLPWPAAMPG